MAVIVPLSGPTRIKLNNLRNQFPLREEMEKSLRTDIPSEVYKKRTEKLHNAVNNLAGYYDGSTLEEPKGFRNAKEASDTLRYLVGALGVDTDRHNAVWDRVVLMSESDFSAEAKEIIEAAKNLDIDVLPQRSKDR